MNTYLFTIKSRFRLSDFKKLHLYTFCIICFISAISCSSSSEAFLEKGRQMMQQGDFKGALDFLNKAIEKDPENVDALNARGVANLELKQYAAAQLDFDQAIKLNSNTYKPYYNRGRNQAAQQKWQPALEDFSKAVQMAPDTADIYFNRGVIYFQLNQFPEALQDFSKAILLNPQNHDYYYNRGTTKLRIQDVQGALDDFQHSIQVNPRFAKGYYTLGLEELLSKNKEDGCEHLHRSDELGYPEAKQAIEMYCKN
ncbi:tetratricopeptide repeat protein [Xanthocytophaga flava]